MSSDLKLLLATAASVGFIHTLIGPDHYIPFVAIARARSWGRTKLAAITALCGLGHVASSVILGIIGAYLGIAVSRWTHMESLRGNIAAWGLIAFGFAYAVWGMRRAIRNKPHRHFHIHEDGSEHAHDHAHQDKHLHVHTKGKTDITPWILFTLFAFGPCEPLIPLLMYPAARAGCLQFASVASVFAAATVATMLAIVMLSSLGLELIRFKSVERYSHAAAGAAILICGLSIVFLGL